MAVNKQKKLKILVVDSSASLRALLGRLAEECDMEATLCTQVTEARVAISSHVFELVVAAPEFADGRYSDVLAAVRAQAEMALAPVLLILSGREDEVAQEALDNGITDVFHKRNIEDLARYMESLGKPGLIRKKERRLLARALVVEDDRALGSYYKAILEEHGFAADHVPSGEAALWDTERHRYEFILVDLVLGPGCSGIQFLRRLRQPGNASAQSVAIAISAYNDETRRLEALRAGANAFIAKPINERELAAHIEGMAHRPATEGKANTRSATADDPPSCTRCQPCQLTQRESNICALVAAGYSDKRIADEMGVSYWTVRTHIAHAFKKCDVVNRVELVRRLQGG